MEVDWQVGEKLVCIINITPSIFGETVPNVDDVYTIRDIDASDLGVGVRLNEIVNPEYYYSAGMMECRFLTRCFRKLVFRKSTEKTRETAKV